MLFRSSYPAPLFLRIICTFCHVFYSYIFYHSQRVITITRNNFRGIIYFLFHLPALIFDIFCYLPSLLQLIDVLFVLNIDDILCAIYRFPCRRKDLFMDGSVMLRDISCRGFNGISPIILFRFFDINLVLF